MMRSAGGRPAFRAAAILVAFLLSVLLPSLSTAQQNQSRPQTQTHPQTRPQIPTKPFEVYAAANLRDPLTELAKVFERTNPTWRVNLDYATSAEIEGYLKTRAPMDVLIVSSEKEISDWSTENLILPGSTTRLLSDEVVIVGATATTNEIKEAKDLVFPDLKQVALLQGTKGFAKACKDYLTKIGIMQSLNGKIVEVKSTHEGVQKVIAGQAQWTFVNASTATGNDKLKVLWHVPITEIPADSYFAAIPAYSTNVAAAKSFLTVLHSTIAAMIFRNAGYVIPETQTQTQTRAMRQSQTRPQTRPAKHPHPHKKKAGKQKAKKPKAKPS